MAISRGPSPHPQRRRTCPTVDANGSSRIYGEFHTRECVFGSGSDTLQIHERLLEQN